MTLQVPPVTQSKETFGLQAWLQRIVRAINDNTIRITPTGVVVAYTGSTAPDNWLLCDGSAVSRTTYNELFSLIGTIYGSGDGSTTFNLPDLRGRTIFGKDDMGGSAASRVTSAGSGIDGATVGAVGGSEFMQAHGHPGSTVPSNTTGGLGASNRVLESDNGGGASTATATIASAGSGDAENMPPAIILNYIIKY